MTAVTTSSHPLLRHPGNTLHAQLSITVVCKHSSAGELALGYQLCGPLNHLRLPAPNDQPQRQDGLWQHSCFEAFIRIPDAADYWEYNFAPNRDWALYRFASYRSPAQYPDTATPEIKVSSDGDEFCLDTAISVPTGALLQIGLSAVLEDLSGNLSYWALHHPTEQADFHHPDAFTLELE